MKKRCPNCMEPLKRGTKGICPACGFTTDISNDSDRLAVGTVIKERYLIGTQIKRDEVSTLYLAYDEVREQKVFVRECTGDFAEKYSTAENPLTPENEVLRFIKYGRAMAEISICDVLPRTVDIFENDYKGYVVSEYFDGKSLKELMYNNIHISTTSVLSIAERLCSAVKAVHSAGLIYGTVCPENVYILKDGSVRLFGIGSPFFDNINDLNTRVEIINPSYAAPELYNTGAVLGVYTDIYSISAIMYRILTGTIPPVSFLRSGGETIKGVKKHNKGVGKNISAAILNGLNWQASARPQNVQTFLLQLSGSSVKRKTTPQIVLSYVIGYTKLAATKISAFTKGLFKGLAKNFGTMSKRRRNIIVFSVIGGVVVIALAVSACFIFLKNGKTTQSASSETQWYYGTADISVTSSNKNSYSNTKSSSSKKSKTSSKSSSSSEVSSKAPELKKCPNLVGMPYRDAFKEIEKSGFVVGKVSFSASETIRDGCVATQSVPAGKEMEKGSAIDVVISQGKPTEKSKMPNLVGKTLQAAVDELETLKADYKIVFEENSQKAGTVIKQSILANELLEGQVTITVSGIKITVPNLVGKTVEEAQQIEDIKIIRIVDQNNDVCDALMAKDYIIKEQNIKEGSINYKGCEVIITVDDTTNITTPIEPR